MESFRIVKAQGKNCMLENDVITQGYIGLILLIKLCNKNISVPFPLQLPAFEHKEPVYSSSSSFTFLKAAPQAPPLSAISFTFLF